MAVRTLPVKVLLIRTFTSASRKYPHPAFQTAGLRADPLIRIGQRSTESSKMRILTHGNRKTPESQERIRDLLHRFTRKRK